MFSMYFELHTYWILSMWSGDPYAFPVITTLAEQQLVNLGIRCTGLHWIIYIVVCLVIVRTWYSGCTKSSFLEKLFDHKLLSCHETFVVHSTWVRGKTQETSTLHHLFRVCFLSFAFLVKYTALLQYIEHCFGKPNYRLSILLVSYGLNMWHLSTK